MAEPEKEFRVDAVVASIYSNTGQSAHGLRTYKSVRLYRHFKDRYGKKQTTQWLNATDVPKAMLALHWAFEHIMKDAKDETSLRKLGYTSEHPFRTNSNKENTLGNRVANNDSGQGASAYSQAKREWDKR